QQYDPAISPDKSKVSFTSPGPLGTSELYVLDLATHTLTDVTHTTTSVGFSNWAYDGQRMIYEEYVGSAPTGSWELFTINIDGTNKVPLTNDPLHRDFYPDISHDGTKVAWTKEVNGNRDVYLADFDGAQLSNNHDVTPNPSTD